MRVKATQLMCGLAVFFLFGSAHAKKALDLEAAAKKFNNPLSDAWLMIFQNN